jgi:hypothetical protein
MKRIILNISVLAAVGLFLSGCYTVVWSPENNFPTQSDYEQGYNDGYYNSPFYGDYGYYYNYPWWLNITPPASNAQTTNRDNTATGAVRNNDGGRGNAPRDRGEINNSPPPAINSGDSSSSSGTGVNKSSTGSSSSSTSGRNSSSSSSSDSNNVRNSNGSRNSGGRK